MGAPVGNTNSSTENRLWANTIRRAIVQGDPERLRKIAEKLLDKAAEGDMAAMKELGDRLDGKAAQSVDVGNKDGQPFLTKLVREIVRATDSDSGGV
jgi:hypothetical protein